MGVVSISANLLANFWWESETSSVNTTLYGSLRARGSPRHWDLISTWSDWARHPAIWRVDWGNSRGLNWNCRHFLLGAVWKGTYRTSNRTRLSGKLRRWWKYEVGNIKREEWQMRLSEWSARRTPVCDIIIAAREVIVKVTNLINAAFKLVS